MELSVAVWSDIACPWCLVGKRRLEQAISSFEKSHENVRVCVEWRSFELDSRQKDKSDETPYVTRLARKYGRTEAQAQGMVDNMVSTGADEGIRFDFDAAKPANTFDAHRLLHFAKGLDETAELQGKLKEQLFVAHFEHGIDIGSREGLLQVAATVELPVDEVAALLASDDFAEEVRMDQQEAQMHGVTGVPFFAIGRFGVAGAQRATTLLDVLERAYGEAQQSAHEQALLNAAEGAVCTPETC